MDPQKKVARIAGALYLVVVLAGLLTLMYIPSKLIVWKDASATVHNITDSEALFRFGILISILCYTAFLFLPIVLFKLFKKVNRIFALAMVILAVVSVPLSLFNLTNEYAVLTLIGKPNYLKVLEPEKLQAQVMLYLDFYNNGLALVSIFWGLWLFPFGYLVFKSGFLPKILGIILMAGCIGDLLSSCGSFLCHSFYNWGISGFLSLPGSIGEIGICLWLLIVGTKYKIPPTAFDTENLLNDK